MTGASPALLLVEDDNMLAEQTGKALTRLGARVTIALSVSEALNTLSSLTELDAAVLDQNLNEQNGLDLIEPIVAKFPRCRVIMLTGYGSIAAAVTATHRGAFNYLTKPASAEAILQALQTHPADDTPALPETPPSLQRLEWEHIQRTLDAHDGNISRAADALGIHRRTLQRRLKKRPSASEYQREKR